MLRVKELVDQLLGKETLKGGEQLELGGGVGQELAFLRGRVGGVATGNIKYG